MTTDAKPYRVLRALDGPNATVRVVQRPNGLYCEITKVFREGDNVISIRPFGADRLNSCMTNFNRVKANIERSKREREFKKG
jgi:hypothetical protein